MKKYIALLVLVLFCSSALCVEAAEGSLELIVPAKQEMDITYTKVAEWREGKIVLTEQFEQCNLNLNEVTKGKDIRKSVEELSIYKTAEDGRVTVRDGHGKICGLEDGIYLVQGNTKEGMEMQDVLISIPGWSEEQGEMLYDLTVMPKIANESCGAETGDHSALYMVLAVCLISLLFVVKTLYFSLILC